MPRFDITKDYPVSIVVEAEDEEAALAAFDAAVDRVSPWDVINAALANTEWSVGDPYDDTDVVEIDGDGVPTLDPEWVAQRIVNVRDLT